MNALMLIEVELVVGDEPEPGIELETTIGRELTDDDRPRPPDCKCHGEVGDSLCPVHPSEDA